MGENMTVVKAVNEVYSIKNNSSPTIFLAGGISNCHDWQSDALREFKKIDSHDFTIYSPRRDNFPIDDPEAAEQQIVWEYNHLRDADIIIFWFSGGSLNPIVLYELGMWGNSTDKPIFVGCDPEYTRTQDVTIQTKLARPEISIYSNLMELCYDVMKYIVVGETNVAE
jgi:hypothetical protein